MAENEVASFTGKSVTNNTGDTTPPGPPSASVKGNSLTLTFNEDLEPARFRPGPRSA